MGHLQMVKQEEMGRKGREGRPRHGAMGSPSSVRNGRSLVPGREAGTAAVEEEDYEERNSLEIVLFYTLISHRSCPWNLCGREKPKSVEPREKQLLERGSSALWGSPALPPPPLPLRGRAEEWGSGLWLCETSARAVTSPVDESVSQPLNWKQLPEGTPPFPISGAAAQSWQAK